MSEVNEAPLLVVAGVHNEASLGWSAAQSWLDADPNNQLLVTVRSDKARDFLEAEREKNDQRIDVKTIDWTESTAVESLHSALTAIIGGDRAVSGTVHSIASAPPENFVTPAHELDSEIYDETLKATALSLIKLVQATKDNLTPQGGVVTFGFGEYRRLVKEYGPALSTAKVTLSHLVTELASSLGQANPPARTAEIVTGFIPTYAGRGVLAGISRQQGKRIKQPEIEDYFRQNSALRTANSDEQRQNAGQIAIDFIAHPKWRQTTGQRFEVNAGYPLISSPLVPSKE